MAQKVGELPVVTSVDDDDKTLIYNIVTEDTKLINATDLIASSDSILHLDKATEIDTVTYKAAPHASDVLLIEDSEDSFNKKKIDLSTLGGGLGGIPDAPIDSKVYARKDGTWVNPSIGLVNSRIIWKPTSPPQLQLCLVNNTKQTITYTANTIIDPSISVNLAAGEITVNDDLIQMDMNIDLQVIRQQGGVGSALWGVAVEEWNGTSWAMTDSVRYFYFTREIEDDIRSLSFTIPFTSVAGGTKFRLVQICNKVGEDVGLISTKPFTSLPQSSGAIITITTR